VTLLKLILIEQLGEGLADLSKDFLDVAHVFVTLLHILLKMKSLISGELNLKLLHLDLIDLLLNVEKGFLHGRLKGKELVVDFLTPLIGGRTMRSSAA
jgi:hypothetical protein